MNAYNKLIYQKGTESARRNVTFVLILLFQTTTYKDFIQVTGFVLYIVLHSIFIYGHNRSQNSPLPFLDIM